LWKAKQDHEEKLAELEGNHYTRESIIDVDGIMNNINKMDMNNSIIEMKKPKSSIHEVNVQVNAQIKKD
jgi:hypothetical protein